MAADLYALEVAPTNGRMSDEFARASPVVARTTKIRADQILSQLNCASPGLRAPRAAPMAQRQQNP